MGQAEVEEGKDHLAVHTFQIFLSRRIGGRFIQQAGFIEELEVIVPTFYRDVGADLGAWVKKPPRIESETAAEDVSLSAISKEAEAFEEDS